MWVKNYGDMTIGNVASGFSGLQASGQLNLILASTLVVNEPIDSQGADIVLGASEEVVIASPMISHGGNVTIQAGTFLTFTNTGFVDAVMGQPMVSLTAASGYFYMEGDSHVNAAAGGISIHATSEVTVSNIMA